MEVFQDWCVFGSLVLKHSLETVERFFSLFPFESVLVTALSIFKLSRAVSLSFQSVSSLHAFSKCCCLFHDSFFTGALKFLSVLWVLDGGRHNNQMAQKLRQFDSQLPLHHSLPTDVMPLCCPLHSPWNHLSSPGLSPVSREYCCCYRKHLMMC